MRGTITARGQTVIPAPIRERFSLSPSQRLEWIVEADDSIRVVPVDPSPVKAFRGRGCCKGSTQRLMAPLVLLDTSALLTLRDDEPGADWVEALPRSVNS